MAGMTKYTDQGVREIATGLARAQGVLRRRRGNLQERVAAIENELTELATIESAIGMALEVLRAEAGRREQAAQEGQR